MNHALHPMKTNRFGRTFRIALMSVAAAILATLHCKANSEMRNWTYTSGETLRAELVSVDEAKQSVRLRSDKGTETVLPTAQLSTLDRAWVLEWVEMGEELEALVKKLGGRIDHHEGKGATMVTGFHVYHPSGEITPGTQRPLIVLFDPSGNPMRYLMRHLEAADQTKFTLVSCEVFRNSLDDKEGLDRFKDVLPVILQTVPHDPKRIFLGGTSGGALRAFDLSAAVKETPWAGIYSNGGWLGGSKNYNLPYPSQMRVAMVNGDKDIAANSWMDGDCTALKNRGITISVMAFEGGHQIPPVSVQAKAFKWLLKELE